MTRRILLDTDLAMGAPGSDIDDGFALALALADPELSLELVTTVNGNTDVDTATRLSVELLARLGREDIPVVRGAGAPLHGAGRGRGGIRAAVGSNGAAISEPFWPSADLVGMLRLHTKTGLVTRPARMARYWPGRLRGPRRNNQHLQHADRVARTRVPDPRRTL